jgi:hypothetical protein
MADDVTRSQTICQRRRTERLLTEDMRQTGLTGGFEKVRIEHPQELDSIKAFP